MSLPADAPRPVALLAGGAHVSVTDDEARFRFRMVLSSQIKCQACSILCTYTKTPFRKEPAGCRHQLLCLYHSYLVR